MSDFNKDYNKWLYENHGAKTIYDFNLLMKHRFLLKYMDVNDVPIPPSIGEAAYEYKMEKIRKETYAMEKFYNDNRDSLIKQIVSLE